MKINLPDIEIQPGWTIPGQVKKIGEEYSEVAEAVAMSDPVSTIREALDTMQTCATLISLVQSEYNLNLARLLLEHEEKLINKGYMGTPRHSRNWTCGFCGFLNMSKHEVCERCGTARNE